MRVSGTTGTASAPDGIRMGTAPDAYARSRPSRVGIINERLERRVILELAGNVSGRTVLDVGCGEGDLALVLAKRGADVTGIDSSAAMIGAAGRRTKRHGVDIVFQRADAEWLPFHPEEFDIVTVVSMLCFLEDADPVLQEIARALKPGGRLVIGELGSWSSWPVGPRVQCELGSPTRRPTRFRTARELRELVERAGFIVETVHGAAHHPHGVWAARWLSPYELRLGRLTAAGAGFVALAARRPLEGTPWGQRPQCLNPMES